MQLSRPVSGRILFTAAFAFALIVAGCADNSFTSSDDLLEDQSIQEGKLRHANLMDRAGKFLSRGKDGDSEGLGLIVALHPQKVIERHKVLERYKQLERYKVIERFEYTEAMDGFALAISDNLGLGDYSSFVALLQDDPDILWFEPDISMGSGPQNRIARATKGDQLLPWGVERIGAYKRGLSGVDKVRLFVIDTGIDAADIDFEGQDDLTDDLSGSKDVDGHGTHIAGIAAAKDDSDGIVGVAPKVKVRSLRVLTGLETDDGGELDLSTAIAAVEEIMKYKMSNPAMPVVVNMSLGADVGTSQYNALDEAMEAAIAQGVVFVVSAGNNAADASTYTPAHVDGAITVGAFDQNDSFAWFSNFGPKVDILAPGSEILSLRPGSNEVDEMSGTSMAAAHVAGAAALFLSQNRYATPQQVRDALVGSGRPDIQNVPGGTTNRTVYVGADGSLFDASLPPFFRYAIVAHDDIEFDAYVTIEREDSAPLNTSVFTNKDLKLQNTFSHVEGFGYFAGSTDRNRAAEAFAPRYNPAGLLPYQDVQTKMVIPEFDSRNYRHLATRFHDGDLNLSGHYELGTEAEPVIWYVKGKLKTAADASFSGYGVFLVESDVELKHGFTAADGESVVGLYVSNNFKVRNTASITLTGQIYANDIQIESDMTLYGSITSTHWVKFKNNAAINIFYRPAHKALTQPFWN